MQEETLRHQLVHPKENRYFALTMLFSILAYISLLFSIIGIIIIAVIILISYFSHALSMASIRRNGVRISEKQFPEIYEKAVQVANEMGLEKMPSIYVVEATGVLNAFATRFFGKNMVVMYSEIFDLSEEGKEDELLFVLVHEFAHLKRRHVLVHFLLLPAMYIPFLGEAYLRACEYTCDRYAAFYTKNLEASKEALTMLAIGKKLSHKVNKEAFIEQIREESGFFAWLSEKLASHPHLPKRLNALDHWVAPEDHLLVKEKKRTVVAGVIISAVVFIALPVGVGVAIYKLASMDALSGIFSDEVGIYEDYEIEGATPLMEAADIGDIEEMEKMISEGEDIEAKDEDGSTALQWAVSSEDTEAAKFLLENGADINTIDTWKSTPLIYASSFEDSEMVELLLGYNPDTTIKDEEGMTALDYAKDYENEEIIDLLSK
ncbi:hypothetical protein D0463_01355 [Bacillus sp. V59.32b]|nr:hypothetical protein D0463_01355 [Bacillus sp. V59.32b]